MIARILAICGKIASIPARLKLWAAAAFGVLMLAFGIYRKGVSDTKAKRAARASRADQQIHERINHANTGSGLDDGQRIDRLRDFAAKHGNGSSKGKGG